MLKNKVVLELVWWLLTAVIVVLVMYPIYHYFPSFVFKNTNILLIVCAITFGRYIFFLNYTPIDNMKFVKVAFMLLTAPLVFFLIEKLNDFQTYMGEKDQATVLYDVAEKNQSWMLNYVMTEYRLFAVSAIVLAVVLMIRLLMSIWTKINIFKEKY
jgi:hypothetical protein